MAKTSRRLEGRFQRGEFEGVFRRKNKTHEERPSGDVFENIQGVYCSLCLTYVEYIFEPRESGRENYT